MHFFIASFNKLLFYTWFQPRHNPFNSVPIELDFEETDIPFTSGPGLRKSLDRGSDSQG